MLANNMQSLVLRTIVTLASISCYVIGQEDVRLPPSITKIPKSEIVFKGQDRLELPCEASGIPEPTYTWYKDGELLEIKDRMSIDPPESGKLVVDPAIGYTENGNYTCRASNKYGVALSGKIMVKQANIVFRSRTEPLTKTVNMGESLVLEPFDKIESFPEPLYNWKTVTDASTNEDQKLLITTPRIALHPHNGKLYFAHILSDDVEGGRIYKMDVYNAIEDITRGGSPYIINAVEGPIANKGPMLLTPSSEDYEIIGIRGKNATLKCFFGGYPTPEITWRLPPNPPQQSRIDCTQEHNTECLIRNLHYTDSGTYTCKGKNVEGKGVAKFRLVVESVPTFKTAPQNLNGTEGESVIFKCEPDARPDAKIQWYTNGELIDPTDPGSSKLVISKDGTELFMRDICKNCDEGDKRSDLQVFMCGISNKHGESFASAYLNVIEATTIYETSERVIELDPATGEPMEANFTCKATTDPLMKEQMEQSWWHNDGRLYSAEPYTITEDEHYLYINLTHLNDEERRDYVGEFECRAYTKYSSAKVIFKLIIKGIKPRGTTFADVWWILLIILLLILLLLLCICCCCYMKRNKGESYPVDEKERANGNDPEKELKDMDFHEHHRDAGYHDDYKGSKASLLHTGSQHSIQKI